MSRVAKRPVALPQGVTATITPSQVTIKGAKGSLNVAVSNGVSVKEENKQLQVSYTDGDGVAALAGSTRAHLANVVQGVTAGFEKKLELVGVAGDVEQAAAPGVRFLVDAYCGSGLFALSAAPAFEQVAGIEISESSIRFAKENAAANGIGSDRAKTSSG